MALGAEEVVAIAICGALAAIGMGWALTHRFYMNKQREEVQMPSSSGYSQAQYMREVRLRHQEDLAASQYGRGHFPMVRSTFVPHAWDMARMCRMSSG